MAGLDASGLTIKRFEDVLNDIEARAQVAWGPGITLLASKVFGHLANIFGVDIAEVYELVQAVYDSFNPNAAQGVQLDNLTAITGVTREPATFTSGTVTIAGDVGTVVPAGKLVRNAVTADVFVLQDTVTIPIGGSITATADAETAGPLPALATEISEIVTPVVGWDSVSNVADFDTGQAVETDAELRVRRDASLQIVGAGPDHAIRARLEALDDVDTATVISNRTSTTDAGGRPGKSFEAIISPDTGVDEDRVATTIWASMPGGIEPHGDETKTVTDDQGNSQTVKFSYAAPIAIWIIINLTATTDYPADGDDQVRAAVLALQDGWSPGVDVINTDALRAVLTVPGNNLIEILISKKSVGPPTLEVNVVIDPDERAYFEVSATDIEVNS